jgi:1,4-alpha-glucan branching enzyme
MQPKPFYNTDPWLAPFSGAITERYRKCISKEAEITGNGSLSDFAMGHHYYGLHRTAESWIIREWAPNATQIFLIGTHNGWKEDSDFLFRKISDEGSEK